MPVAKPRLHLDADASRKGLWAALLARGHDVTRTPNSWMPLDASDEDQLLGATAQGRCILTFNIRDFMALAARHPQHGGIILAAQTKWRLPGLVEVVDRLLSNIQSDELVGQIRWLKQEGG